MLTDVQIIQLREILLMPEVTPDDPLLTRLAVITPPVETRVIELITDYQTSVTTLESLRESGQGSLIKADVLEWSPGSRELAFRNTLGDIANRIRILLGLPRVYLNENCRVTAFVPLKSVF